MPGNIIVIAGEPNAGKTGLILNIIRENMHRFKIHYFNSEMGRGELKRRLSKFDGVPLSAWKQMKAWERSGNFADVIKPGKGNVNVIDFLEIHDNFYEMGKHFLDIHNKLKGAVAIVAIQKNPGSDLGLGGGRSLEKARLYLSMSQGVLKIVKCKNFAGETNPNGLQISFDLVQGCRFITKSKWQRGL